ncbi:MAG: gliding motility-associated C-terminal domain-containing protein [Bacteroidetes bacterium]|nr:gliding motility-associated C-terminal domain-containing protein [Bacteroidota bacterium]
MKHTTAIYAIILLAVISFSSCKKENYTISCTEGYTYETFEGGYLFMPNAFTPSSDGVNDRLIVITEGIADYDLQIFADKGDAIFTKSTYGIENWNGQIGSGMAPSGSYTFILTYTTNNGEKKVKTGKITVIDTLSMDAYLNETCVRNLSSCVFGSQWQGNNLPLKPIKESGEYFRDACY